MPAAAPFLQVLRITGQIDPNASRTISIQTANRTAPVTVDAVSAFLRTIPKSDGTQNATEDELQLLERQVRIRISLTPQLNYLITPQMVPVRAFIAKETGPVPCPPFVVQGQDQTTVEWEADANTFLQGPFTAGLGSAVYLEVILWGSK